MHHDSWKPHHVIQDPSLGKISFFFLILSLSFPFVWHKSDCWILWPNVSALTSSDAAVWGITGMPFLRDHCRVSLTSRTTHLPGIPLHRPQPKSARLFCLFLDLLILPVIAWVTDSSVYWLSLMLAAVTNTLQIAFSFSNMFVFHAYHCPLTCIFLVGHLPCDPGDPDSFPFCGQP